MLRTIIVEDETGAQNLLKNILKEYCPNVQLLGIASNITDSIHLISQTQPDLVFMDIELADGNSFEILNNVDYNKFRIIFTTAYENFALKAFKYEAVDYLLKPFGPVDMQLALSKVSTKAIQNNVLESLSSMLKQSIPTRNKISIHTAKGTQIVNLDEIIRLEADSTYCTIITQSGEKILVSKSLKTVEEEIAHLSFFRVHASHLININFVKHYNNADGGSITLTNGDSVPLSRRRKQDFIDKISNL